MAATQTKTPAGKLFSQNTQNWKPWRAGYSFVPLARKTHAGAASEQAHEECHQQADGCAGAHADQQLPRYVRALRQGRALGPDLFEG